MRIDVSLILDAPGRSMPFDQKGHVGDVGVPGEGDLLLGPQHARGVVTSIGGGVYVEANVKGSVRLTCSRCLSPFDKDLEIACEGKFMEDPGRMNKDDEDDVEVFPLEGTYCNLDEMVRHEIALAIPMKPLCREDCRGLCPGCGKNLNEGDCDCLVPQGKPSVFGEKLLEALEERSKKRDGRP